MLTNKLDNDLVIIRVSLTKENDVIDLFLVLRKQNLTPEQNNLNESFEFVLFYPVKAKILM